MQDRDIADLANALLIAAGLGLAFACAYLVRRPAPRTLRVWVGATLVAVPGLLFGLVASDSDLGVRAAYRNLTDVLQDPLIIEAEIIVPRPKVDTTGPPVDDEIQGTPSLAPAAEATDAVPAEPSADGEDPAPSPSPAPTTETETPPPSPSETPPPPAPEPTPSAATDPEVAADPRSARSG
ncbi:MAG: hypothetical protein ACXWW9_03395 [Actinomycetota bacterium]